MAQVVQAFDLRGGRCRGKEGVIGQHVTALHENNGTELLPARNHSNKRGDNILLSGPTWIGAGVEMKIYLSHAEISAKVGR